LRILILGAFNSGALENFYLNGFRQQDMECEAFDISSAYYKAFQKNTLNKIINKIAPHLFLVGTNRELVKFCKGKMFDVILVFKGHTLFTATLESLKKSTRLLCSYNPDHPFKYFTPGSGNDLVRKGFSHYHLHFSYARSIVKTIREQYQQEGFWIPFGYDPALAAGNKEISDQQGNYLLFYGAYDAERAALLESLKGVPLKIYGDQHWQSMTSRYNHVLQSFKGIKLYGDDLARENQQALGVVNILRTQNLVEGSHNMRTFEVPAYGGLLISNYTEEQAEFFEPGKEALYYRSASELPAMVSELRKSSTLSLQLKKGAQRRCLAEQYSYTDRAREMVRVFNTFL
jgi:spore maturation protein CgeB